MGQTLTHGVYLPDEGERNCYSGLAANWQILDTSVGTIAAHTAALAGKAPLVHTHTKSDITDFPAYGNAAGTICEGNDSRLSDARTPVAHTHTKSDVTDLLNSNFIPSANNSYDLGSSSYQWNNLYAKNYYYNGVAWGLNKANTWSGSNTYAKTVTLYNSDDTQSVPTLYLRNSKAELSSSGNTSSYQDISFRDKNDTNYAYIRSGVQSNGSILNLKVFAKDSNNNSVENTIQIISFTNGTKALLPVDSGTDLGNSNYKWKSFNGINPGALSFPEGTISNANTTFNPDLTNWLTDGTGFTITAQVTGWLHIRIQNSTGNFAWVKRATAGNNQTWGIVGNSDTYSNIVDIPLNVPVVQDYTYTLKIKSSRVSAAIFMCLGNV